MFYAGLVYIGAAGVAYGWADWNYRDEKVVLVTGCFAFSPVLFIAGLMLGTVPYINRTSAYLNQSLNQKMLRVYITIYLLILLTFFVGAVQVGLANTAYKWQTGLDCTYYFTLFV